MLYQHTAVLVGTGNTEWLALLSPAVIAEGMMSSHFILIHILWWDCEAHPSAPRWRPPPGPDTRSGLLTCLEWAWAHLSAGKARGHTWIPRLEDYLIQAQFSHRYISKASVVVPAELASALGSFSHTGVQPSNTSKYDDDESRRAGRYNLL